MRVLQRAAAREAWGQRALPAALRDQRLIAAAAMAAGDGDGCVRACRTAAEATSLSLLLHGRGVEAVLAGPALALARFGRWRALDAEEPPSPLWPLATALYHLARGLACAWRGEIEAAHRHHAAMVAAQRGLAEGAMAGENDARVVVGVARRLLGGELFLRAGERDEGLAMLQAAVEVEDAMRPNEPPDWPWPIRHTLGATLLDLGRPEEAESIYRADLGLRPENGWALFGLAESLAAQGRADEAEDARARFALAWANADTRLLHTRHGIPRRG